MKAILIASERGFELSFHFACATSSRTAMTASQPEVGTAGTTGTTSRVVATIASSFGRASSGVRVRGVSRGVPPNPVQPTPPSRRG